MGTQLQDRIQAALASEGLAIELTADQIEALSKKADCLAKRGLDYEVLVTKEQVHKETIFATVGSEPYGLSYEEILEQYTKEYTVIDTEFRIDLSPIGPWSRRMLEFFVGYHFFWPGKRTRGSAWDQYGQQFTRYNEYKNR